jgi:CheY-like chemotaxis protein
MNVTVKRVLVADDSGEARRMMSVLLRREGFEPVKDRVSDHKSHPNAYGEYRGLLKKMR